MTPEQVIQNQLDQQLNDCRASRHKTVPTMTYKIGERVQRGSVKSSTVTEILDDGHILKLHEIFTENNYGKPYDRERDDYVMWYQVTKYHTAEENDALPTFTHRGSLRRLNYSQRSLMGFFSMVYRFGVDMDPIYQRGNVWSLEDKQALIHSIFNEVDIGKFVFIHLDYKGGDLPLYEILDGKQRLNAIIDFFENRYTYQGKYYHELSYRDQAHLEDYPISWAEIQNITLKQKLEYFIRLNVSGKPQDPEHMKRVEDLYKKEA